MNDREIQAVIDRYDYFVTDIYERFDEEDSDYRYGDDGVEPE